MTVCNNCPRKCNVDRKNAVGFCGMPENIVVAKAGLFQWEEPCVSIGAGSGAVFFTGCNLKCVFCQNWEISSNHVGKEINVNQLAEIFKNLVNLGAQNINLVSPSHYYKQIIEALKIYRPNVPIIYNSNGYDSVESIVALKDYVDVYLVDVKYFDSNLSARLSNAPDYFDVASKALEQMIKNQPKIVMQNGAIKKGVIVRHLVLPNHTDDSVKVLEYLSKYREQIIVSLMSQYTPVFKASEHADINRKLKPIEYKFVVGKARELGFENGYIQDFTSSDCKFIPDWDFEGVE